MDIAAAPSGPPSPLAPLAGRAAGAALGFVNPKGGIGRFVTVFRICGYYIHSTKQGFRNVCR